MAWFQGCIKWLHFSSSLVCLCCFWIVLWHCQFLLRERNKTCLEVWYWSEILLPGPIFGIAVGTAVRQRCNMMFASSFKFLKYSITVTVALVSLLKMCGPERDRFVLNLESWRWGWVLSWGGVLFLDVVVGEAARWSLDGGVFSGRRERCRRVQLRLWAAALKTSRCSHSCPRAERCAPAGTATPGEWSQPHPYSPT